MISDHPLFLKLLSLNLPVEDYAIFGSAPMFARGLKDLGHDLDVVVCREAWERAKTFGPVEYLEIGHIPVVQLFDRQLELGNGWFMGGWTAEEIVDSAEVIEGFKFATLDKVLTYKKLFGRPKDLEHIKIIEEYLAKGGK